MESYQYPHLKLVQDVDDGYLRRMGLQYLMVGKVPDFVQDDVTEAKIQAEIRNLFEFVVPLDRISRCGSDYLIQVSSSIEYVLVLTRGYFHSLKLTVMPWTREYGSTVVPFESQFRNLETINFERIVVDMENLYGDRDVVIQIWGVPAHLCNEGTVHELLGDVCHIRHVSFVRFTCSVVARILDLGSLPSHVNIGVRKMVGTQCVLNVWPVWYKILPLLVGGTGGGQG